MTEVVVPSNHGQPPHLSMTEAISQSAMAGRPSEPALARHADPETTSSSAVPARASPSPSPTPTRTPTHPSSSSPTPPLATSSPPAAPTPDPALESPRARSPRKRARSINTEEANHPRLEDLSLTPSTASPHSAGPRDLICLCTPAPKVPRPRNAFILYRQHHQANVVAGNPGLANPEISKIIGFKWKGETEAVKSQWKLLAEEEKVRHQRQYPDYRYQPRRGGKTSTIRPMSISGEDPGRCPKCGGRYIATPHSPATPLVNPIGAKAPMAHSYVSPNPRVIETDHMRRDSVMGHEDAFRARSHSHWSSPMQSLVHNAGEDYEARSPSDNKRRRYDMPGGYQAQAMGGSVSSMSLYGGPQYARPIRLPSVASYASEQVYFSGGYGPAPFPGPAVLTPRSTSMAPMGPPPHPRPHPHPHARPSISYAAASPHPPPPSPSQSAHPRPPRTASTAGFDESLRLPPLQTQPVQSTSPRPEPMQGVSVGGGTVGAIPPSPQSLRESQARSVEAMVMSIPFMNKLKVLNKISPPLAPPGPTSPAVETRGPVIAVEGVNSQLMPKVAMIVQAALASSGDFAVRGWSNHEGIASAQNDKRDIHPLHAAGVGGTGLASLPSLGASVESSFAGYLQTIQEWHVKSTDIVHFVTTHPPASLAGRGSDASTLSEDADARAGSDTSADAILPAPHPLHKQGGAGQQAPHLLPVALISGGFSLTVSDRFASTVPILDAYAPVDHWQWMATLWRGIVGPDLVIYVRTIGGSTMEEDPSRQGSTPPAVELHAPGVMVINVSAYDGPVLPEKTERRLGFEVVEWVRSGTYRDALGRG